MYPHRDLTRLAMRKGALRRDIGLRRIRCAAAVHGVMRPLRWLDRVQAFGRQLAPLAGPLGLFVARLVFPRLKILRPLARWSPVVFAALRGLRAAVRPSSA